MADDDKPAGDGAERKDDLPPWLEPVPEEEEGGSLPRPWMIIGGVAIVLIFAVLVWFMYARTVDGGDGDDVPFVEAPEGPVKVAPEDSGGMDIPDQDKRVFDPIAGETSDIPENVQDGPEEPVERPQAPIEERTDIVPTAAEESAPEPEREVAPAAPVGTHLLQLGAFRSEDAAASEWQRLNGRYSAILTGLNPDIERADLGERGVFFRLRGGPFPDETAATRTCDRLKAVGQGCIVVAR